MSLSERKPHMNIKVNYDIGTIFREIVYVRNNHTECECSNQDPQQAVNLTYNMYLVCATCGGLVLNDFDTSDQLREQREEDHEQYILDHEPGEPVYE